MAWTDRTRVWTQMTGFLGSCSPGQPPQKDVPTRRHSGRLCLPVRETWVQSLGQEVLLEKGKATHSSIHAWKIPWTKEPGGLQSMGLQRVRHDWAASLLSLNFYWYCQNNHTVLLFLINKIFFFHIVKMVLIMKMIYISYHSFAMYLIILMQN